jgi:hypothetical protein
MKSRILRSALVVLALAAQGAAGFFLVRVEGQKAAARESFSTLLRDTGHVQTLVGELRGAEGGLVATGQDPAEWVPRLAGLIQNATDALKKIDRAALAPDSTQDLAAATEAVAAFARTSDRVRDLLATEQPLTASSVVFGDAAQHLGTAAAALASVASSQAGAVEREIARLRLLQISALAGAAGFTLIVLLILLPRVERIVADESSPEATAAGLGLSMTMRGGGDPELPHESEEEIEQEIRRESGLRLNTDAQVDLAEAARLCSDLARVKDGGELAGLLALAAEVLDAAGIVLWIVGPDGSALRPAASHGYSEHALARMRTLSGRSENAVSVAFRTGRLEVVRGTRERHGALVAPIVAAGGCVGAMAAEIRHGAETSPSVQAVATILAAQLASLVAETTTS